MIVANLLLLLLAFVSLPPTRVSIAVQNHLAIARESETVELAWRAVLGHLPTASPARIRVVDGAGREITSQVIDSDSNGTPELLIFQSSFRANEIRKFFLEDAPPALKPVSRVHVRHDEPRDDVAWESDRIAFRIYGQGLMKTPDAISTSGVDVWVKRVRTPVLEKWYDKAHGS